MASPQENIQQLYESAKKHYDMPDFQTFQKDMEDEGNRKQFYGSMQKHFSLPDFETFTNDIGFGASAQPAAATSTPAPKAQAQPADEVPTFEVQSEADINAMDKGEKPAAPAPAPAPQQPVADATGTETNQEPAPTPEPAPEPEPETPLTPEQRENMRNSFGLRMQMLDDLGELSKEAKAAQERLGRIGLTKPTETRDVQTGATTYQTPFGEITEQTGSEWLGRRKQQALNDYWRYKWETETPEGQSSAQSRLEREYQDKEASFWARHQDILAGDAWDMAWQQAEQRYAEGKNKAAEQAWGDYTKQARQSLGALGGHEHRVMASGQHAVSALAAKLRSFDLKQMADDAWENLGNEQQRALIDDYRQMIAGRYPGANEVEVEALAQDMAKAQVSARLYDYAVAQNMPKSATEFFGRKMAESNLLYSLTRGLARMEAGTIGDLEAREQADEIYRQDGHKLLAIGGGAMGMVMDPVMLLSSVMGGGVAKGAMWLGNRMLVGKGSQALVNSTMRMMGTSLTNRFATSSLSTAATLGLYDAEKEGERQFVMGGWVNPETGKLEDYNVGEMKSRGARGALMGAIIGPFGPAFGNAGAWASRSIESTAGKFAAKYGIVGAGMAAEGTVFAIPEVYEALEAGDKDAAIDAWTNSELTILALKGQHAIKSAPKVISELCSTAEGRKGMESRLRQHMDERYYDGRNTDLRLTADEKEELKKYGYDLTWLADAAELDRGFDPKNEKRPHALEGVLQQMIGDNRISEAARAKLYYYATGRMLPMSKIMVGTMSQDADGTYVVDSHSANGVVTHRRFKSERNARLELDRINRQVELNQVEVLERKKDFEGIEHSFQQACWDVGKANSWHPAGVYRIAQAAVNEMRGGKTNKPLTDAERDIANKVLESMDLKSSASEALRAQIKEERGVDIDAALRKEPGRRSAEENAVIKEYVDQLYASPTAALDVDPAFDRIADQSVERPAPAGPQLALPGPAGEAAPEQPAAAEQTPASDTEQGAPKLGKGFAYMTDEAGNRKLVSVSGEVVTADNLDFFGLTPADTDKIGKYECYTADGQQMFLTDEELMNMGYEADKAQPAAPQAEGEQTPAAPEPEQPLADARGTEANQEPQPVAEANQPAAEETLQPVADATGTEANQPATEVAAEQPAAQPQAVAEKPASALERVPKDAKGEYDFEAVDTDTAWDGLVELSEGDKAFARQIAEAQVERWQGEMTKANKAAEKVGKGSPTQMAMARKAANEKKAAIQQKIDHWNKVMMVEQARRNAQLKEYEAQARVEAERREAERAAREEQERIEREALQGIPEWHMDKPEDARARGARRVNGQLVQRREPIDLASTPGVEQDVVFSKQDRAKGKRVILDMAEHQPQASHEQGQANPLHFIEEAQPKNRAENVSAKSAMDIASDIDPAQIVGGATAYVGEPTLIPTLEGVQGNNRIDALKQLWGNNLPEQQKKYRDYLMAHAAEYGRTPEEIAAMKQPYAATIIDVDDAEAIRLGQLTSQDTESGGVERIKPKHIAGKMGDNMRNFANLLLRSEDESESFGQLIDRNGDEALRWLRDRNYINDTQYMSAYDSKGAMTAEAKNDLGKVLYQAVFRGGSQQLEEAFEKLPAKAQRAILSTAFRDLDSPQAQTALNEIQASIIAYNELMATPAFAQAKNLKEALNAVEAFKAQTTLDDTFEVHNPSEKFSNFAMHMAALYKAPDYPQKQIAATYNNIFDLVQGKKGGNLFEEGDKAMRPLTEAIEETLNLKYEPAKNGNDGSNDVAVRNQGSQGGEQARAESPASGERNSAEPGSPDSGAGAAADSKPAPAVEGEAAKSEPTLKQVMEEVGLKEDMVPTEEMRSEIVGKVIGKDGTLIGEDGQPMVLYHGTQAKDLTLDMLEGGHVRSDGDNANFVGYGVASFTPDHVVAGEYAIDGTVFSAHITMKKPFIRFGVNSEWAGDQAKRLTEALIKEGYDGIIGYPSRHVYDANQPIEVIPFAKEQIRGIDAGVVEEPRGRWKAPADMPTLFDEEPAKKEAGKPTEGEKTLAAGKPLVEAESRKPEAAEVKMTAEEKAESLSAIVDEHRQAMLDLEESDRAGEDLQGALQAMDDMAQRIARMYGEEPTDEQAAQAMASLANDMRSVRLELLKQAKAEIKADGEEGKQAYVDRKGEAVKYESMVEDSPLMQRKAGSLDTEGGEFCKVERTFAEDGTFDFTRGGKVESAADVAFIFKELEDEEIEHSFMVLVKDGVPTVLHMCMGKFDAALVNEGAIWLANYRINPDKVYFVHNHPSGTLMCSAADRGVLRNINTLLGTEVEGVIINLRSGKFCTFDGAGSYEGDVAKPSETLPVQSFKMGKQIYGPDFDPSADIISNSHDVAAFLNSHRVGDRKKISYLVLSRQGSVVANIHTPYTKLAGNTDALATHAKENAIQFGGSSVIFYGCGNFKTAKERADLARLREKVSMGGAVAMHDFVSVDGRFSAADQGVIEPEAKYQPRAGEPRAGEPRADARGTGANTEVGTEANAKVGTEANAEVRNRAERKSSIGETPADGEARAGEVEDKAKAITEFARGLGREVVFDGDFEGGNERGYVEGGVLHINPKMKASEQAAFVVGHEFAHTIEGTKEYDQLAEYIKKSPLMKDFLKERTQELREAGKWNEDRDMTHDELVEHTLGLYLENGKDIDRAGAEREVAADFMSAKVFSDEKNLRHLANNVPGAKGVLRRMLDAIVKFLKKITGRYTEMEKIRDKVQQAVNAADRYEVAKQEIEHSIRSMRHDLADGKMFDDLVNKGVMSREESDQLRLEIASLVEYMADPIRRSLVDMNETYGALDRQFFPFKPNSDPLYGISMDFSTLCSKRILTQYVIEALETRLSNSSGLKVAGEGEERGKVLSGEQQMAIRSLLEKYRKEQSETSEEMAKKMKTFQVACAMCYVEAARLKAPKQKERWLGDERATIIRQFLAEGNPEWRAECKEFSDDWDEKHGYPRGTKKMDMPKKDRDARYFAVRRKKLSYQLSPEEQAIVDRGVALPRTAFLTAANLAALAEKEPQVFGAYARFITRSTKSKGLERDEPYYYGDSWLDNGKNKVVTDTFIDNVNEENGMRFSSWSDWRIIHLLDYVTSVIEMSVRGAAMHGYTKFPNEVRALGNTGMMFNLSGVLQGKTGMKPDGTLDFSPTESVDIEEALKVRDEFPETAGLQAIAVSRESLLAMLDSDIIDYVIPYHKSGLPMRLRRIAKIDGWTDYEGKQHAEIIKGMLNTSDNPNWHKEPVFSEFFVGYEAGMSGIDAMRASAERYKQLCAERGLTPKFAEFADHKNYWKLLIDRKMINQKTGELIRQRAVKPIFDFKRLREIVDEEVSLSNESMKEDALSYVLDNLGEVPRIIREMASAAAEKKAKAKAKAEAEGKGGRKYSIIGEKDEARALGNAVTGVLKDGGIKVVTDKAEMQKAIEDSGFESLEQMTTWHGSPYSFKAFDHSNMGKGEGGQVHGWGTYVALNRETAEGYAMRNAPLDIPRIEWEISFRKQQLPFVPKKRREELEAEIANFQEDLKNASKARNLYKVEVPEDTGENYIYEKKDITRQQREAVTNWLKKNTRLNSERINDTVGGYAINGTLYEQPQSGGSLYKALTYALQTPKSASKALSEMGIVGIKYEGRIDGPCAVIFKESDANITEHIQFMRTSKGEVYGFVKGGKIYLDPDLMNPNTPIHEYTHLWDKALNKSNPALWERGKGLMKELPLWDEVKNDPAYSDIAKDEDLLASEVHSRLAGEDGERILNEMAAKGGAQAATLKERVKKWLREVMEWVRDAFGKWTDKDLQSLTIEEFSKMPAKDAANGRNPLDMLSEDVAGPLADARGTAADGGAEEPRYKLATPDGQRREAEPTSVEAKRAKVEEMGKRFGTEVEVVEDANQIQDSDAARLKRKRGAKGWYDRATGKVVVVLGNHADAEDVAATVLHETVGHKGLREMMGSEEKYNGFLDDVYDHLEDDIRKEIDDRASRSFLRDVTENGEESRSRQDHVREAMDEKMAELAEKDPAKMTEKEQGFWSMIKRRVMEAISKLLSGVKLPKWVKLGDNELRYMIWRSAQRLQGKGKDHPVDIARDIVQRQEMGLDSTAEPRYREGKQGETDDIWEDHSMGLKERMTEAATRLADRQKDDVELRTRAVNAIGANLSDLRKAMSAQKRYDQSTVKRVADLARILIENGSLTELTPGEIKRLLSAVKNSTGAKDIKAQTDRIMGIMVDSQLRQASERLSHLLAIRGSKVDAKGVEVQGELDPRGAAVVRALREGMKLKDADLDEALADAQDRMTDADRIVAEDAATEYEGLQLAKEYADDVKTLDGNERTLRGELKKAAADHRSGALSKDAYDDAVASIEEAMLKNKVDKIEALNSYVERLSGVMMGSIDRAQQWRDSQKQRIEHIHHMANSDMQGRPYDEHHNEGLADAIVNNGLVRIMLAPLATFEQMLRMVGSKAVNGEGYVWNNYVRGWVDCREKELLGLHAKTQECDKKVSKITNGKIKSVGKFISKVSKKKAGSVDFMDGGRMKSHKLTQGNFMYIYMVNKMSDGRMKLRRMGIGEDTMEQITNALDPRLRAFADWVQEEFLPRCRGEYNETHKQVYGASMAAIEDYYPLKIRSTARTDKEEDLEQNGQRGGISSVTNAIKKRLINSLAVDVTQVDALELLLDHIAEMEHWNAFAQWKEDLNKLRTYKRFRNQILNMRSMYGAGKTLWKEFNDVCDMAAGSYRPPQAKLDKFAVNVAKGWTSALISFRGFTALKQALSVVAYAPDVSAPAISEAIAKLPKSWDWCMKNLPIIRERWESRIAGDPRLLKNEKDWAIWSKPWVKEWNRWGMVPNALVDIATVCVGAKAIYETRYKRYIKEGYSKEAADRRAKQDATIIPNLTQQSSESPFLSTMQVDRSFFTTMFTVFRNGPMAYTRQVADAVRNLKRTMTPGYKDESVEFMAKQLLREWGREEEAQGDDDDAKRLRDKAKEVARTRYGRQIRKDLIRLVTNGYLNQLAWYIGSYAVLLGLSGDDDRRKEAAKEAATHALMGPVEGLTGGDVISTIGNMAMQGKFDRYMISKDMPLVDEASKILDKFGQGKNHEGVCDIINLAIATGIGTNPSTITNFVVAIADACGDEPRLMHEYGILAARIFNSPQSQIDELYFEELGMSGAEARKYTPQELAQRYAEYKVMKGQVFLPKTWHDEKDLDRYREKALERIKTDANGSGDANVNEEYAQLSVRADRVAAMMTEANKLRMDDYAEWAKAVAMIRQDPDYPFYLQYNKMNATLKEMAKVYLRSEDPEKSAYAEQMMPRFKAAMVRALNGDEGAMDEVGEMAGEFKQRTRFGEIQ